jgi:hypothetical protein
VSIVRGHTPTKISNYYFNLQYLAPLPDEASA